jgi:hypothetical protein
MKNRVAAPKAMLRKWSKQQQEMFRFVGDNILMMGPSCFLHPKTKMSSVEFRVIAHNAAFTAADELKNVLR